MEEETVEQWSFPGKVLLSFPLLLLFFIIFSIPSFTFAAKALTLAWDPNTETDLAGYKFYQGTTSGSFGPSVDVGNNTTHYYKPRG
jgi:hypothetical protein